MSNLQTIPCPKCGSSRTDTNSLGCSFCDKCCSVFTVWQNKAINTLRCDLGQSDHYLSLARLNLIDSQEEIADLRNRNLGLNNRITERIEEINKLNEVIQQQTHYAVTNSVEHAKEINNLRAQITTLKTKLAAAKENGLDVRVGA